MGSEVHVSSIAAFREFAVRYKRFAQAVLEILEKAEADFRRRWEILEERYRLQQRRVAELRRRLEETDDEEERRYYENLLAEAEEDLQEMRRQMGQVREQYEAYRHHAQRIRELANQLTPKAVAFLDGRASELEAYVAVAIPGTEAGPVTPSTTASPPETSASAPASPAAPDITRYALPPGFEWVPLDEIAMDDLPEDTEFHKASREEMLAGMSKLPQVLELLQDRLDQSRTDNTLYFWRLDRQAGRSYREGLQGAYEAFFGSEPIRLERSAEGGRWRITNGRHRVKLAKELRWSAVPASVSDYDGRF